MIIDPEMKMNALELAIKSHEDRANGGYGIQNCPLCGLVDDIDDCDNCPIKAITSENTCSGTPFYRTIEQRDRICVGKCPKECVHINKCSNGYTEYCIIEEEFEVSFLKWVRYNLKMGWIE